MKKTTIIVAGGSGTRMSGEIPKQFMKITGKPLLILSFNPFWQYDPSTRFILVLNKNYVSLWDQVKKEYQFQVEHEIVPGGKTRFHSVLNALKLIHEETLIAVHDAVRPLVSPATISRCFKVAETEGCAIPCIEINESVREIYSEGSRSVNRDKLRIIQTPQVFRSEILQEAYRQEYMQDFTDDASVVEHAGYKVTLVQGNRENIKITTREDLLLAEAMLNQ